MYLCISILWTVCVWESIFTWGYVHKILYEVLNHKQRELGDSGKEYRKLFHQGLVKQLWHILRVLVAETFIKKCQQNVLQLL